MKLYLLTKGSYSDYHVIGILDNKDKADKLRKDLDLNEIEEFELNKFGKDDRFCFRVSFYCNSTSGSEDRNWAEFYETYDNEYIPLNTIYTYRDYDQDVYSVKVLAEDKEHAIRIASDLIAQYRALNK